MESVYKILDTIYWIIHYVIIVILPIGFIFLCIINGCDNSEPYNGVFICDDNDFYHKYDDCDGLKSCNSYDDIMYIEELDAIHIGKEPCHICY